MHSYEILSKRLLTYKKVLPLFEGLVFSPAMGILQSATEKYWVGTVLVADDQIIRQVVQYHSTIALVARPDIYISYLTNISFVSV